MAARRGGVDRMSTMVEILQRIVETRGAGCEWGLCAELDLADDYDEDLIDSIFKTWEHFSGSVVYPVPYPEKPGDPKAARAVFWDMRREGGFIGEYGELRLDLTRHLLKELSK